MNLTARRLFVVVLILGILFCAIRTVIDPDLFWHLRTGELIAQTHAIPSVDPFSYTANGNPWVTHEWLTELFIYGIYQLGGFPAIIFAFALLITGIYVFSYLTCPQASKPYVAGFSVFLGALTAAPAWNARPQIFSLLLFSVFLFLLERYKRDHALRHLLPLPFLMVLWANFHGGFIFGIALIAIYIAAPLIDWLWERLKRHENERASLKPVLLLTATMVACLLAVMINPSGPRLLVYPIQALIDPSLMTYITEFQSPDFHQAMWLPLLAMFLLLLITAMKRKSIGSTEHVLLVVAFSILALRSQYHVAFFALAATPVLAAQFDWILIPPEIKANPKKLLGLLNGLVVILLVGVVAWRFVTISASQPEAVAYKYPEKAVDWIIQNRPSGKLFNSFNWGGYLIWRLYPDYPVYIDGRPDMYGPAFFEKYVSLYRAEPDWQQALDEKNIGIVFIEPDLNLANDLRQTTGWYIAYEDANSIIFLRE